MTSKFVDEVEFGVVPLDICGVARTYMIEKKSSIENIINITCLKKELST